jgi:dTDP-4-dehydrorhamnose reductase
LTQPRRILILGASGQVGSELQRAFAGAGEVLAFDRRECDLSDAAQLRATVRAAAPDVILSAAGYTAVDRAETERDLANALNGIASEILAEEALRRNALLVHYSTDYIFDGSKTAPWVETDAANPLNHYGASKLAGERAIAQAGGRYLIFRTSWVYGPRGNNFLLTMLRLGRERDRLTIVDDQSGAPTTSMAIADATRRVVDGVLEGTYGDAADWAGLYHMTCGGATTWFGFAQEIFARAGRLPGASRSPEIVPISTTEWPTPAKRPLNSVLSNEKLRSRFGIELSPWKAELERTFKLLAQAS